MPLEVIENITRVEADNRERKASGKKPRRRRSACAVRRRSGWTWLPISLSEGL